MTTVIAIYEKGQPPILKSTITSEDPMRAHLMARNTIRVLYARARIPAAPFETDPLFYAETIQ